MLTYLSLHTKVRRLGYLKLIVEQYFNKDFIPINYFSQQFEKIAGNTFIVHQLEEYARFYKKDDKGIIENKLGTGSSADPYLRLAEDLSIIARSNYSFILTKYAKVYRVVLERYQKETSKFKYIEEQKVVKPLVLFYEEKSQKNIFVLNALDKFFFLRILIEKDFLFLKALLIVINNHENQSSRFEKIKYGVIKNNITDEVLNQLRKFQHLNNINLNERQKAINLERKFSNKNLQIRSFESIVEPRLNWLLDLDLIDGYKFKQEIIMLSNSGRLLLEKIRNIFDVTFFLEAEYISCFCSVYELVPRMEKSPEKKLEKYLDYAFVNFRTLAPNRITASQAINYICVMCLLRDGLKIEYKEVKNYIFSIDGKGFTIDWFPSENDGSIKKILE